MPASSFARRDVLAAALIGALLGRADHAAAAAAAPAKLFQGTALADNPLARRFEPLPAGVHAPSAPLQTEEGQAALAALRSPATLVTLWAEFCAPCLMEMPDLAALQHRYAAAGFNVVALHIGGSVASAKAKLATINAAFMPCWNDTNAAVATAIATPPGAHGFTLPCNFLVDRHGHVRGRAFGAESLTPLAHTGKALTEQDKQQIMRSRSLWSLPAGDQFAQALAGGLLDRI